MIVESIPSAHFLFVNAHGHRYSDAAAYIEKIKEMIAARGVLERVRFIEHISHDRISKYYSAANVTISIPIEDSFPATIFEAMACESPLVVPDLPDYAGVVDSTCAMLIQPTDHEGLAQAVITLARDQKPRESLISNGLQIARTHGNLDFEVDRLMEFYQEVAGV